MTEEEIKVYREKPTWWMILFAVLTFAGFNFLYIEISSIKNDVSELKIGIEVVRSEFNSTMERNTNQIKSIVYSYKEEVLKMDLNNSKKQMGLELELQKIKYRNLELKLLQLERDKT